MSNFTKFIGVLFILVNTSLFAQEFSIELEKSNIQWKGAKLTGAHTGSIKFQEGNIVLKDGKLVGGKFIVDMKTINNDDLSGRSKNRLVNHLKSDDFFGVDQHPTSTLIFKELNLVDSNQYNIIADLTIKGITQPVEFVVNIDDRQGSAKLVIDRSKYNVRYGSKSFFDNLGDKVINDEFEITVNVVY